LSGPRRREASGRRCGLLWERDAPQLDPAPLARPALALDPELSCRLPSENLIVEGDNLEALRALRRAYRRQVKAIYIDPPYNTGSRARGYNDDYVDRGGAFRHSLWLEFMYRRLALARELLHADGFLCVSIGEEEFAHLKLLLDEVFGSENFRNALVVRRFDKNLTNQFVAAGLDRLAVGCEYVLVYSLRPDARLVPVYRPSAERRRARGYWKGFWNAADRPTMRYPLLGVRPERGQWKWERPKAEAAVRNYEAFLASAAQRMSLEAYWEQTERVLKFIRRNPRGRGRNGGVEHWVPPAEGILRTSNWTDLIASADLKPLGVAFPHPKNPELIKALLRMTCGPDGLILDFFAGSGTTGQAVLELNAADGGSRRFILVSATEATEGDPRRNLCRDACAERVRRAVEGYADGERGVQVPLGGGFAYLRVIEGAQRAPA
jgi:adenine-specific DNA-methyltransferase